MCGDLHRPAVPESPAAPCGGEEVVAQGIEHHRRHHLAVLAAGDRDREDRQPLHEIRGSVEGIDVPSIVRVAAFVETGLFRQDVMVGEAPADHLDHPCLALVVGAGDEIMRPLAADLQCGVAKIVKKHGSSGSGGFFGDVAKLFVHRGPRGLPPGGSSTAEAAL